MPHPRRALPAAATTACALLLSGCVVIQNVSEQQVDGIGPVRVNVTLCSSGDDAACVEQGHPTGGNDGTSGPDTGANPAQLLVGFRIPDAYATPATLTSADHPEVTFAPSPSYAAGLEGVSPSGPGQQWVGFISSTTTMGTGAKAPGTIDAMTVTTNFAVPAGAPSFAYRPVVGARLAGTDPTRPVNCNETSDPGGGVGPIPTIFCIDSPSTAVTGTSALGTNRPVVVRGLALTADPAPVKGARGTRVPIPFTAVLTGSGGSAGLFTVAGTTTVPGGVVRGRQLPLAGPGNAPALVRVSVPRTTKPGTYAVNATVTQGAQTRSITRPLVVTGTGAAKLKLGTRFGSRLDRRGRSAVTISCPASAEEGCVGSVTLNTASRVAVPAAKAKRRVLRLGKARFRLKAGTKGTLRIKVARKARKVLRAKGRLRVKATFVTGRGSTAARAGRFYTLRVAKRKR